MYFSNFFWFLNNLPLLLFVSLVISDDGEAIQCPQSDQEWTSGHHPRAHHVPQLPPVRRVVLYQGINRHRLDSFPRSLQTDPTTSSAFPRSPSLDRVISRIRKDRLRLTSMEVNKEHYSIEVIFLLFRALYRNFLACRSHLRQWGVISMRRDSLDDVPSRSHSSRRTRRRVSRGRRTISTGLRSSGEGTLEWRVQVHDDGNGQNWQKIRCSIPVAHHKTWRGFVHVWGCFHTAGVAHCSELKGSCARRSTGTS